MRAQGAQGSPVTEAISAAVERSAGVALGGAATFIPLLERCGTETLLQVARQPPGDWGNRTKTFHTLFLCLRMAGSPCLSGKQSTLTLAVLLRPTASCGIRWLGCDQRIVCGMFVESGHSLLGRP